MDLKGPTQQYYICGKENSSQSLRRKVMCFEEACVQAMGVFDSFGRGTGAVAYGA